MAESNRNSYGNIFKATALFGGVRVFSILIHIIRAKIVAILIGPAGMGINNLLRSTLDTVNHVTGCGLQTSAVRDVAKSYDSGNQERVDVVITSLRAIVWATGLIATAIVFLGSDLLSMFAFGNHDYSTAFKYLSVIMFFTQLNTGQIALLQGTFHYKKLASCTLWGNALSLVLTVPLYYLYREDGIVPALIVASLVTLFFSWRASKKVTYHYVKLPIKTLWQEGKGMLTLGFVIAMGGMIGNLSTYIMNIFISHEGSLDAVGLYSAGVTIANSYIFLVMSAMSTDYIPRLSALNGNDEEQNATINKQMVLILTILLPLIVALMVFSREAIVILYTSEFLVIDHMIELFMVGMFLQAATWCISYSLVAKGCSKLFLATECYNFVVAIVFKIAGFYYGGFIGLGIAFIIDYVFELGLIWYVCHKKYHFAFSKECREIFVRGLACCLVSLVIVLQPSLILKYTLGSVFFIITTIYSFKELDKRIGVKSLFGKYLKKKS